MPPKNKSGLSTHYILTNREVLVDSSTNEEFINNDGYEPATELFRWATFDVNENEPKLIKDLDPSKEPDLRLKGNTDPSTLSGSERIFQELYTRMKTTTGGDVLIYIHGFNNDLQAGLNAVKVLHNELVVDPESVIEDIVLFSWPARNDIKYKSDCRDAEVSGVALGRAFEKLLSFFQENFKENTDPDRQPCLRNIHLMCHSMGNRVFESMVQYLVSEGKSASLFKEVILTAADIDNNALQAPKALSKVTRFCDRVHVYFNQHDKALWISSSTKNPASRLGKTGPEDLTQIASNITTVDVSYVQDWIAPIMDNLSRHGYHLTDKFVVDDIKQVLNGKQLEKFEGRNTTSDRNLFRLTPSVATSLSDLQERSKLAIDVFNPRDIFVKRANWNKEPRTTEVINPAG